jgi:hypothetical protein
VFRRDLWFAGLVFLAIISLGHIWHGSTDAIQRLQLTRSLVFAGSVHTRDYGPIKYAPLQSVVMAPAYVCGYLAGKTIGADEARAHGIAYRFSAVFYAPVVTAITAVVFFELLLALALPARIAVTSAYLLVMATLLLPYSRIMFSEILSGLLVLASCSLIVADRGGWRRALLVTVMLGLLCLNGAVFFPLFVLVLAGWVIVRARSRGRREAATTATIGLGVFTGVLALWAWYNWARYGNPVTFGYEGEGFTTPLMTGLYGLTLSVGRGLVFFSPLTALGAAGLAAYRGRVPPLARQPLLLFAGVAAVYLVIFSTWHMFEGGWTWGPRFLLTFVPMLHIGVALMLNAAPAWSRVRRGALLVAIAWAMLINAWEFLGVYQQYEGRLDPSDRAAYLRTVFEPAYAAIFNNWDRRAFVSRFPQFVAVAVALWVALSVYQRRLFAARD